MIDLTAADWTLALSEPGAVETPEAADGLSGRVPARVPGTAAGALAAAGRYDPDNPQPLHDKDVWFEASFGAEPGRYRLDLEGLATIAEVYLNGAPVLESRNMFRKYNVEVELAAHNRLQICFRALEPHLNAKGPRARWKPQLATSQGLRLIRTTVLGHMPGWCPEIHAVGPYRPIRLEKGLQPPRMKNKRILADLAPDGSATLTVSAALENISATPVLTSAGVSAEMARQDGGTFAATLRPGNITPWMPHTHGDPALYDVRIKAGEHEFDLGKTGFRRIEADPGEDGKGFGLQVNGVPVFLPRRRVDQCRSARPFRGSRNLSAPAGSGPRCRHEHAAHRRHDALRKPRLLQTLR
ncbi:hypothetical protein QW131_27365 [Roseibium salinum]|nr:hypothetical protein [Roseibium salinum]